MNYEAIKSYYHAERKFTDTGRLKSQIVDMFINFLNDVT